MKGLPKRSLANAQRALGGTEENGGAKAADNTRGPERATSCEGAEMRREAWAGAAEAVGLLVGVLAGSAGARHQRVCDRERACVWGGAIAGAYADHSRTLQPASVTGISLTMCPHVQALSRGQWVRLTASFRP